MRGRFLGTNIVDNKERSQRSLEKQVLMMSLEKKAQIGPVLMSNDL